MTINTIVSTVDKEVALWQRAASPRDVESARAEFDALAAPSQRRPIDPALEETVINYVWPRGKVS